MVRLGVVLHSLRAYWLSDEETYVVSLLYFVISVESNSHLAQLS